MNYRLATILNREAVLSDYTKVIDLTLADPVSQFQIVYESLGATSGPADHHAAKCITKIELVDGSDVLFSLSGQECQAVDFYHNKKEPANLNLYLDTNRAEMVFNINFGRFLYDPLFSFDPKRFTNPQLKISMVRGNGGVSSVAGHLQVLAKIFDGKVIEPEGFLMHKEVKNYGLGSNSHEYTDMPTDYPYRKLFIAAHREANAMDWLINTIKLSEDNDRKIPFDASLYQILRALVAETKPYREGIIGSLGAATGSFYCTPNYWPTLIATAWEGSSQAGVITCFGGDGGKGEFYCSALITNYNLVVEGYCPHGAIEIPFGLQDDPDDWYDVTKLGSLRLDILSGDGRTTADTVQIFLQQLRKYA